MRFETDKYSERTILDALRSASRQVYYRYTLQDVHGNTIGDADIIDGVITFDSTQPVMRTFQGRIHKSEIVDLNSVDLRIVPWMCLKIKNDELRWPLGCFIISPVENNERFSKTIDVVGYDLGKIALDYKEESRVFISSETRPTNMVMHLLGDLYSNYEIEDIDKYTYDTEWNIGTSRLDVINKLLSTVGYDPLYFDEKGTAVSSLHELSEIREVEMIYKADETSIILDGITRNSGLFDVANKFVRWVEDPTQDYIVSVYTNDDPESPYSTVSRGRVIVDAESVTGFKTQEELDTYLSTVVEENMQAHEEINFYSMNMPGHGYKTCMWIDIPQYSILGKYIETGWEMHLSNGGVMMHRCSKAVKL